MRLLHKGLLLVLLLECFSLVQSIEFLSRLWDKVLNKIQPKPTMLTAEDYFADYISNKHYPDKAKYSVYKIYSTASTERPGRTNWTMSLLLKKQPKANNTAYPLPYLQCFDVHVEREDKKEYIVNNYNCPGLKDNELILTTLNKDVIVEAATQYVEKIKRTHRSSKFVVWKIPRVTNTTVENHIGDLINVTLNLKVQMVLIEDIERKSSRVIECSGVVLQYIGIPQKNNVVKVQKEGVCSQVFIPKMIKD
uniref:Uncharacterized protein n=1 Tax=Cacopsylla melanoneura TaxID=428564 RepID=A0A8D8QWJ1_9HEMI